MKIIFLFFLFITNSIYFSIDKLVTALKIKNSEEVINYLSLEGEIVINGFSSKGNKYKMIKVLDDFYLIMTLLISTLSIKEIQKIT